MAAIHNGATESYVKVINPELYERMRRFKVLSREEGADFLRYITKTARSCLISLLVSSWLRSVEDHSAITKIFS